MDFFMYPTSVESHPRFITRNKKLEVSRCCIVINLG